MRSVKFAIAAMVYIALLGGLVGCSFDRWEGVKASDYVVASGEGLPNVVGSKAVQFMQISE